MNTILVASPSAFLRMSLAQQLRLRQTRVRTAEAASPADAMRILAQESVDVAIVDESLLAADMAGHLVAALEPNAARTLLIATGRAGSSGPVDRGCFRVIDGGLDGVLNIGAVTRALPEALDRVVATAGVRRPCPAASQPVAQERRTPRSPDVVLVAASTGGPTALTTLLKRMGPPHCPVIIAQHMPADQTASFARYLTLETGLAVTETRGGNLAAGATITVLRGGSDYRLRRGQGGQLRVAPAEAEQTPFHPSADLLFSSAAESGIEAVAVVLSGMGDDGAKGAAALAARGGRVLVQDFESCVVAGMPSAASAACPTATIARLDDIADRLARWARAGKAGSGA